MEYTRERLEELISQQKLVDCFLDLIKIHAPSLRERDFAAYMIKEMEVLGAEIYLDKGYEKYGGNAPTIIAKFAGSVPGEGLSYSIHLDVIEPHKGVEPIIDGSFVRTDGTTTLGADDRGGCAAVLEALRTIKAHNIAHKDIFIVITPCEELHMYGAKNMDWSAVPSHMMPAKRMIVVDNAGRAGLVAHTGPARYDFEITFRGRKAHAGIEPEKGINAIQLASLAIAEMEIGRLDELTTSNLGNIMTEGPINVVPDACKLIGEMRGHDMARLDAQLAEYREACDRAVAKMGGSYDFEAVLDFPALKPTDDLVFAKEFVALFESIGVQGELQVIGGGSDSNIFAAEGFESIIIGPGIYDAHTLQENLNIDDLYNCTLALIKSMVDSEM